MIFDYNIRRRTIIMSATALFFVFISSILADFVPVYWRGEHIPPERISRFRGQSPEKLRESVIIELKDYSDSRQANILAILQDFGRRGRVRNIRPLWICNVICFDAELSSIEKIRSSIPHGEIRRVYSVELELFDPAVATSVPPPGDSLGWGVQRVNADHVWTEYGIDGSGVLVAILDSGVDFGSLDLADALWSNPGEIPFNGIDDDSNGYIDDWRGWDWTNEDPWPHDERGHGTHVSGTVGGRGVSGYGTGVAPGCTIMPLKILDSNGRGEETQVWEAIQYALEKGARVMNMSIGWRYSSGPDRASWRAAVEAACEAGVVMCIAGGNEGTTSGAPNNLRTPGDVPTALTVGATNFEDERASFSSVGPVAWDTIPGYLDYPYPPGYMKPNISAPGDSIPSVVIGGEYEYWDGTSMACPHVTGASALLLQLDSSLVHYDVVGIIESSAVDLGPAGVDSAYGAGLLDIVSAFALAAGYGWVAGNTIAGSVVEATEYSAWVEVDIAGNYSMKLPAGDRIVKADAFGYNADSTLATIIAGDTTYIDFLLSPGTPSDVELIVRDFDTGEPIPNPVFDFVDWPAESIVADSTGAIVVVIEETDPTEIRATKPGYIGDSRLITFTYLDKSIFYLHRAQDFEDDSILSHWGFPDDWEWGTVTTGFGPEARSGEKLWGTDLDSSYSDTTDSWLGLGSIDLIDDHDNPQLAFYQWYELEATSRGCWDGGNILARRPGGEWEIIDPVEGYPSFLNDYNPITGDQRGYSGEFTHRFWHEVRFDLDSWTGGEVEFVVHMGSDDNTTRQGWFIDDVAIMPETFREPIFRWAEISGGSMALSLKCTLYAVSDPIDTLHIFAHFDSPIADSIRLSLFDEFAMGETSAFSVGDTVETWFSAKDIVGRYALYPSGAPDSTITYIITDSLISDTTSPQVELYGYWCYRFEDLDSIDLGLIIGDESPWNAVFSWGETILSDSLIDFGENVDTLIFRIAVSGSAPIDWSISVTDSAGNTSIPITSEIEFSDNYTLDFHDNSQPAAPRHGSVWCWDSGAGWSAVLSDTVLDDLPLPLFKTAVAVDFVICGDYYFGPSSGGIIRVISEGWDTILTGPSSLPPTNPFYPCESGITMIGDSARFSFEPPSLNENYTIELAVACADTAFWRIDSIHFAPSTCIAEKFLPENPGLSIYPNPFNGNCRIELRGKIAEIEIIDITGRTVRNYFISNNTIEIIWDGRGQGGNLLPTGVYLIKAKGCDLIEKAVYIK